MNFQDLNKVEDVDFYIDLAFRRAKDKSGDIRTSKLKGSRLDKSRYIETRKIELIKDTVVVSFEKIIKSYPSIDTLPEFYLELVKCTLDYPTLKKSLGALGWASKRVDSMFRIYASKINKCQELDRVNGIRREFYGRFSSVMKQIRTEMMYLEEARKVMRSFPSIKTSIPTASIAGFPNIGKTTLLYKLTGSKPEISDYAFTTKGINVAYIMVEGKRTFQLLDTPGTLDRFNKMNSIEQQAYLAMKLISEKIVYVFDLTEPYPIESQLKLYKNISKIEKPVLIYLSKLDIIEKETLEEFLKLSGFSKKDIYTDAEKLKKVLLQ